MERRPPPPPGAPPGFRPGGPAPGPGMLGGNRPRPPPPNQPPPTMHSSTSGNHEHEHYLGGGGGGGYHSQDRFQMSQRGMGNVPFRRSESTGSTMPSSRSDSFVGPRRFDHDSRHPPPPGERRFGELQGHRGSMDSTTPRGFDRSSGDWSSDRDRPNLSERDSRGGYDRAGSIGGDRERFGGSSGSNLGNKFGDFRKDIQNRGGPMPPGRRPPPPAGPPPAVLLRRQASDPGVITTGGGSSQWGGPHQYRGRDDDGRRPGPRDDDFRRGMGGYRRRDVDEDRYRSSGPEETSSGGDKPREVEPGEVIEEGEVVASPPTEVPVEKVQPSGDTANANTDKTVEVKIERTEASILDSSGSTILTNEKNVRIESLSIAEPIQPKKDGTVRRADVEEEGEVKRKPKGEEDEELDEDEDVRKGEGAEETKKRKKKGKRKRLVIDTFDHIDEEEEALGGDDDDHREDELADQDGEIPRRGKKKKKSKFVVDMDDEEGGAGMRAAKKRAAQLMAKPRTPTVSQAPLPSPAAIGKPKPGAQGRPLSAMGNGPAEGGKKRAKMAGDDGNDTGGLGNGAAFMISTSSDVMTSAKLNALREQWKRLIMENKSRFASSGQTSHTLKPFKLLQKKHQGETVHPPSQPPKMRSSPSAQYHRPQDAPGWAEQEKFAKENHDKLLHAMRKRFVLEMNHAKMVLDEYRAVADARKREEEAKAAKAANEFASNAPKRYPSRNNPAAVAIELGQEHGVAEAERREMERRKNAAMLPDLEFRDDYRASVFARMRRDTTDGRPALCFGRNDNADCVTPGQPVPQLIIPSPLGCNCSRAVKEAEKKPWTDVERCIFLDKFLQYPKDFKRIASFFAAKSTEDIIAFYYDTKKMCDYKLYMSEYMRKRNRDHSELATVREHYLAKLGVKMPLCPDLDGLRKFPPAPKEAFSQLPAPCVLYSNVDVFPKHVAVDVFPFPAEICNKPNSVDATEFQNWMLKGVSSS